MHSAGIYCKNPTISFEPEYDKTNTMPRLPSKGADQPGHPLCALRVAKDPSFVREDSEASDHTGRIPRLI